MISLDDVVLRDDLDPRLGERDDDLIAQYADIFDALPPIEINQHNELIDGWHRVRAAVRANKSEIAYVVVETEGDDDLGDRMWAANLKHGVQYTRIQRQTQGLKLHRRGLKAMEIAQRVGVSRSSVYSWTKALRQKERRDRDSEITRLREEGKTQQEIADEVGIRQSTVAEIIGNSNTGKIDSEPEGVVEPAVSVEGGKTGQEPDERLGEEEALAEAESGPLSAETEREESPADEQCDASEPAPEPDTDEASADGLSTAPEVAASAPEGIPDHILETAHAVMVGFVELRPDAYVARLEVSPSEWMTITDDSLSNDLERELLTSAAAMCLWKKWMVWYQGERTSAFTNAFGKTGTVYVRGRSGQWRLVSRFKSMLRRIWD